MLMKRMEADPDEYNPSFRPQLNNRNDEDSESNLSQFHERQDKWYQNSVLRQRSMQLQKIQEENQHCTFRPNL